MPAHQGILERNAQVKQARGLTISIEGLASLSASVKALGRDAEKDMRAGLTAAMIPVVVEARSLTPRRSGALAGSIRPFARGNAVGVRSRLPYANVIHWGGSVGKGHTPNNPWSGRTFIPASLFVSRAIEHHEDQIVKSVGDVMEDHALRTGWIAGANVAVRLTQ